MPIGLCSRYLGVEHGINAVVPSITIFDPDSAQPLAVKELRKDGLLGGVYGFLDENNRVVIAEGHSIVKIGYHKEAGHWTLTEEDRIVLPDLGTQAPIAGLTPDGLGRIWFATKDATVGVIDNAGGIRLHKLGNATNGGEAITNGLTGRPEGASVLTSHALYELSAPVSTEAEINESWRHAYDRGSARKPGQLSWGSGTTPTFFGPNNSRVAIIDNADDSPNLIVLDAATGRETCSIKAFEVGGPGTENSIMASGNSLWLPSTYGYRYPAFAVDGASVPTEAPYEGGLAKVDLVSNPDGSESCVRRWENKTRIATLPVLSTTDHRIWAFTTGDSEGGNEREVSLLSVDAQTGQEISRTPLGVQPIDAPLQLTGMLTPQGDIWQATATRLFKVSN
ncbi:hypothetical protein [Corynebacterium amycolatum]|uniref:hypothetical protein n=1 Tax=Corynebacterium amycolatum TaxID=43765 RepID=UPI003EE19DAD